MYYNKRGEIISIGEWTLLFQDNVYKRVAITSIDEVCEVSTVWLGLDHSYSRSDPILIFETMVFGGDEYDGECWRYSTEEEARTGHEKMVTLVLAGKTPLVEVRSRKIRL
jgi:hypothetical protein